CHQRNSYPWTF
nr:immunoglobulin light chain junction region [Mus musculus]